ncbi:MAG: F0F1 ATP synthase subunit A [Chthonomonadales bacterium]
MPQLGTPVRIAQGPAGHERAGTEAGAPGGEIHASAGPPEHEQYKLGDIPNPGMLFWNAVLVAVLLVAFGAAATRKMQSVPKGLQNFGEFIVEVFINFTRGVIGPGGEKYVPLAGTLFLFIFAGNIWGLIPGFHSPTANLSTTLALGLIVFFYVQYVGIRSNGLWGYIKHFMGPMPAVAILLFPIEVISELVKPFTLAMRLFGNIFGEDTVVILLATLAINMLKPAPILPLQFPIMLLALLTAFVQALVFTLLTCIYISLQSHHDTDHEAEHALGHGHAGIEESGLVP